MDNIALTESGRCLDEKDASSTRPAAQLLPPLPAALEAIRITASPASLERISPASGDSASTVTLTPPRPLLAFDDDDDEGTGIIFPSKGKPSLGIEIACTDGEESLLVTDTPEEGDFSRAKANPSLIAKAPSVAESALFDVLSRTTTQGALRKAPSGSAAYFASMRDNTPTVVIKPRDLEPGTARYADKEVTAPKHGLLPGEGAYSEYLAYKFAAAHEGKFNIPATSIVRIDSAALTGIDEEGTMVCAAQKFVAKARPLFDLKPDERARLSLSQIQNTAIFDIIMVNTDRHAGNILIDEAGNITLIDQGLILPRHFASLAVFCWLKLPQTQLPFDAETLAFIERLDSTTLASILDADTDVEDFAPEKFQDRFMSHLIALEVLKVGAKSGLTAYEIGRFFTKDLKDESLFSSSIAHRIFTKWSASKESPALEDLKTLIRDSIAAYLAGKETASISATGAPLPLEEICTRSLEASKEKISAAFKA